MPRKIPFHPGGPPNEDIPARLITSIRVDGLFGLYTYSLPAVGEFSNAAILYGDNGLGKSTLLRLLFHLLSPGDKRGHRTALYETDFKYLEVALSSGIRLTARVVEQEPSKLLALEVLAGQKRLAIWNFRPRHSETEAAIPGFDAAGRPIRRRRLSPPRRDSEQAYLEALKTHAPTMFILNADRRLDSDSVADPSDEVELRRVMHYGEPTRINELVVRSREIALSQALGAAARWISQKAVLGTNQGSMNVHSAYGDVLNRLLSPTTENDEIRGSGAVADLQQRLALIDDKSAEHARYELATHLPTDNFRKALGRGQRTKKNELAADLLEPYVKSVEGRLAAVEPIYQLIDRFVKIVNDLLRDKSVTFKLSQGFSIHNRLGVLLHPAQLSSGEQQLLLLFCYVLTARDAPTTFMIDEPELSLNIKWQRQLIQSLLQITEGASIQFILASHSMELLAQHRDRVVKLVSKP